MSKAFLAEAIQSSVEITAVAANRAAAGLIDALVKELKKTGGFTLPSFGTFTVKKTKARKGINPRSGEPIKAKAGKTVRFKASPNLKARRAQGFHFAVNTAQGDKVTPATLIAGFRPDTQLCGIALRGETTMRSSSPAKSLRRIFRKPCENLPHWPTRRFTQPRRR